MEKIFLKTQTKWTSQFLGIVMLVVVIILTKIIFSTNSVTQANSFICPIAGLFLVILIYSARKFYQIYFQRHDNLNKLHAGLSVILILGLLNLCIGIFGYYSAMYSAASHSIYSGMYGLITTIVNVNDAQFFTGVEQASKFTAMAMFCLYTSIITAFILFMLQNKINSMH